LRVNFKDKKIVKR